MHKMAKLGRAKMIVREEEELKESTEEEGGEREDSHLGPKCSMSLLDQHSKLKEEAKGWCRVCSWEVGGECVHDKLVESVLMRGWWRVCS